MVQSVYDDLAPQTLGWLPGGYASGLPLQAVRGNGRDSGSVRVSSNVGVFF